MTDIAKQLYDEGKFEEALKTYLEIISREPSDLDALEGIARSLYRLKRYEEAQKYCNRGLEINISCIWPHLIRSYIYYLQKDFDRSKKEAQISREKDPSNWETNFWWGSILDFEGKTDEGLLFLEKAVSMEEDNWFLYHNLSSAYMKKSQYGKYFQTLENMNRLKPDLRTTLLISGWKSLRYLSATIALILYFGCLITIITRSLIMLIIPPLMCLAWLALGVADLFYSKRVQRQGIIFISLGVIHTVALIGVFYVLR